MAGKVILTPQAREDLREIVTFMERDSADKASAFANLLIDNAHSIATLPQPGCIVPELADESIREIIHGSYRIIYLSDKNAGTVFVLRFSHVAPDSTEVTIH